MDHDVIFGLLAVQLGFAAPQDVVKAAASGSKGDRSIASRLELLGMLSPERRRILRAVVEETLAAHGDNVEHTLVALGGRRAVLATFAGESREFLNATGSTLCAQFEDTVANVNVDSDSVTAEQIGRYDFPEGKERAEIGRGGIGKVLVAYDKHLGREIAVKELIHGARGSVEGIPSAQGPMTMARVARFLREARVTGQLEHPNIVPVYEVGARPDGALYYTMRLVRGKTFHEALTECRTLHDRLKLLPRFVDLCQAIAYAHSRGVIHRDIKPHNVMVGEFGETVVLDWGLAKVRGSQDIRGQELEREIDVFKGAAAGQTVDGTAVGTPAYMSPEQAEGSIDEIDERSDVWSLGIVLYEILTGEPPFHGHNPFELVEKVLHQAVKPPNDVDPTVPPDLASVCEKALQRKPDRRYQSAQELAAEIESYQAGGRVRAYGYTSWELFKRLVAQNRALTALVATLVAVLVVGAVVIFSAYRTAEANRVKAETETARALSARQAEEGARLNAEKKERQAHLNLAIAYQEEAGRLIQERDFLGARIFAAAALVNNPFNPESPFKYPPGMAPDTAGNQELLATQHSHVFNSIVNRTVALDRVLAGHSGPATSADFSSDGTLLVTSGLDKTVKLWSIPERRQIAGLTGHAGVVLSVAMSPDGRSLVSGSLDKTLKLWDVTRRSVVASIQPTSGPVRGVDFSPDGRLVVAGLDDNTVRVFTVPDLAEVQVLRGNESMVRGVAFSPDGKFVAAAGMDESVRIWGISDGRQTAVTKGEGGMVLAVAWSPDGRQVAAGYFDGLVRVFDAATLKLSAELAGHDGHVISVSFSPDGTLLASGGHDRRIVLWRVADGKPQAAFIAHQTYVRSVRFSPDGRLLASASEDGTIGIWSLHESSVLAHTSGHKAGIYRLLYSPDGKYLASAALDGAVGLWSQEVKETAAFFEGEGAYVSYLAFSPDSSLLAASGVDSSVRLWSVPQKKQVAQLAGHSDRVDGVAFSREGTVLASAGQDGIKLWSVAEKTEKRHLHTEGARVLAVAFSPVGDLLLSGDEAGLIRYWDSANMSGTRQVKAHDDWVSGLAFSPDGKRLVSAGKDSLVKIWDVETAQPIMELVGHTQWVNLACFSPDGRLVLSGSDDNTARIWDAGSGKVLHIQKMSGEVSGLSFSPAGNRFALAQGPSFYIFPVLFDSWVTNPEKLLQLAQIDAGMELDGFVLNAR